MNEEKSVTQADVHALGETIDTAALASINDAPAPTSASRSEMATFMASAGNRLAQLEAIVGVAGSLASAIDPAASPLIARLAALEHTLEVALASPEAAKIKARISALEAGAGDAFSPSLHARISQIGATVDNMLSAIATHFGDKIPSMPAPGSAGTPVAFTALKST